MLRLANRWIPAKPQARISSHGPKTSPREVSRQCHFEIRQAASPKFLWLIPFTLAKKLLICRTSTVKKFFARQCAAKIRARRCHLQFEEIFGVKTRCFKAQRLDITRKIIRGFEKFSLEEKRILPIIILAVAQERVDLWKTICPRVQRNSGIKFTLPTLAIRNYVLEP